jgi:hypothetical protein
MQSAEFVKEGHIGQNPINKLTMMRRDEAEELKSNQKISVGMI